MVHERLQQNAQQNPFVGLGQEVPANPPADYVVFMNDPPPVRPRGENRCVCNSCERAWAAGL